MPALFSHVLLIRRMFAWTSLAIGGPLNLYLFYLIFGHTPAAMRKYSIILLQTCITDFALVLISALVDENIYVDSTGGLDVWINGPAYISDTKIRWLNFVFTNLWAFLDHVSLFGMVAQFIYRYFLVNRYTTLSLKQYFGLFMIVAIVPSAVFQFLIGAISYPPETHRFLANAEAGQELLGLDPNEPILLSAYSAENTIMTIAFYFLLSTSTIAYTLIVVLGYLIGRFVKGNLKGAANNQQQMMDVHKQITKIMVIQAVLPAFIYMSLVFTLVNSLFHINFGNTFTIYFNIFQTVPMYFPAALNPAVAIYMVKAYRTHTWTLIKETMDILKRIIRCQSVRHHSSTTRVVVLSRNF